MTWYHLQFSITYSVFGITYTKYIIQDTTYKTPFIHAVTGIPGEIYSYFFSE